MSGIPSWQIGLFLIGRRSRLANYSMHQRSLTLLRADVVTNPATESRAELGARDEPPNGASQILRVPLTGKLFGANMVILVVAIVAVLIGHPAAPDRDRLLLVLVGGLAAGAAVNFALVTVALRPIRDVERTVWRLWHGDHGARVPRSMVADADLDQVGGTINSLLDHLDEDRARMRDLASEVIRAEDREADRIGRELHDSIAQSLAGLTYQLAAAENDCREGRTRARIQSIRVQAGQVLDQVDVLSRTVHPRVLNDLGLLAGLRHLVRMVGDGTPSVCVRSVTGSETEFRGLGMETASVLYRVAQEAVQNAMRHAKAQHVWIDLAAEPDEVTLTIADDGMGFDVLEAKRRRPGMGLFTMEERVNLVRGTFSVMTKPREGTTVRVHIPLERSEFSTFAIPASDAAVAITQ